MQDLSKISVVLPSLDPDEKLNAVIDGLLEYGFSNIILVNDGSKQENLHYFTDAAAAHPEIHLLHHEVNRGKGAALKTAFRWFLDNCPEGAGVVTVDGDNQHHPEDTRACCEKMLETGHCILGCRDFTLDHVPNRSRFGNHTTSLVFIFLQFAFGVSAGFCVVTSCQVGARNQAGVRRSLATQIILSAVLTVLLTALALALLNPMLAWINVTPDNAEVYRAAYTYCFIIFAGIGAQLFYNFICAFLRSMGDSLTPLLFLLFSTVLNVGLDLAFILVFRWGVAGAALATVLAQLVSTIGCFIYAFVRYPVLRLHREDWRITLMDVKRHLVRGIPLGLQFSVLAIGIIVMQGGVVQFDMRDGVMVSNAAQNGFGAANRLFNLVATPMNALGGAMTSFTAQNLGAGQYDRIRRGTLQALGMVSILAILAAGTGLLLTRGDFCYHVFLSADKVTPDAVRYGNSLLYVDFSMYLFLGFVFVVRNCVQGIGRSGFVLGAGAAELVARITVCLVLPGLFAGGAVSADAPAMAFYALCAADPMAWIAADTVLCIPFFRNIIKSDYRYLRHSRL